MLGAYVANGLRVGVEYFSANNWNGDVTYATLGDGAHGVFGFRVLSVHAGMGRVRPL